MSENIEVVFETHSVSEDNDNGLATGWNNGRLSERGQVLARELGNRRRHDGIAADFAWREGWEYRIPARAAGQASRR